MAISYPNVNSEFEVKSRTGLAVGVVLLLAGTLAGYLYGINWAPTNTTTVTSTTIISTAGDTYSQVAASFANHMLFLSSRNASAIASQYQDNATVTWFGKENVGGLVGIYNGSRDIFILMNASFIGRGSSFTMGNVSEIIALTSADSATVNSTFAFFGQNPVLEGNFNGTVSAEDHYVYSTSEGAWLISQEVWDFVSFNARGSLMIAG
jgi:hypothetical protein